MSINTKSAGNNGYKAFYKSKTVELYAPSSYQAQQIAAQHFKAKKSYDVTVVLCEKDDETVVHSTAEIG